MSWKVHTKGSTVTIQSVAGEIIAHVGEPNDFRLTTRIKKAQLIAAAPEMEDLLIDLHNLLKRETISEENYELADLLERVMTLYNKINTQPTRKDHNETIKQIISARLQNKKETSLVLHTTENSSQSGDTLGCHSFNEVLDK